VTGVPAPKISCTVAPASRQNVIKVRAARLDEAVGVCG